MHVAHPFANPPRLPSPTKFRTHSRSSSHSPARYRARDHDPLLRDLSPSSTLRAFVSDPSEWTESTPGTLATSVLASSSSERALGAKAAQTCLDVRSWTRELEQWEWPDTFELPQHARKKARESTLSFSTIDSFAPDESDEYCGSLPAALVVSYAARADEIEQALEHINVEELKDFVLSTHYRAGGRPAERDNSASLRQLDDYTAVVTATILQTLPYLSRLNRLLDLWTIRLVILKNATGFVYDLQRARMDMDHGWAAIAVSPTSATNGSTSASFTRNTMLDMKSIIERQVGSLGQRLDRFLDDLEGRAETVPDAWIDDFEKLESAYGDWVVQAERRVLANEWRDMHAHATEGQDDTMATAFDESGVIAHPTLAGVDMDTAREVDLPVLSSQELQHVAREQPTTFGDAEISHVAAVSNYEEDISTSPALLPRLSTSEERKSRNISATAPAELLTLLTQTPTSPALDSSPASVGSPGDDVTPTLARRRAALLNKIELTNTLKQSKSPVRPFEHASNAFTRLFKKARDTEQARPGAGRSNSSTSESSLRSSSQTRAHGTRSVSSGHESNKKPSLSNLDTTQPAEPLPSLASFKATAPGHDVEETEAINDISLGSAVTSFEDSQNHVVDSQANAIRETFGQTLAADSLHERLQEAIFPENWPLPSNADQLPSTAPIEEPGTDGFTFASGEPVLPHSESPTFGQVSIQSRPDAALSRSGSAREPRPTTSWTSSHKRTLSLPRSKGKPSTNTARPSDMTQKFNTFLASLPKPRRRTPTQSVSTTTRTLAPGVPPMADDEKQWPLPPEELEIQDHASEYRIDQDVSALTHTYETEYEMGSSAELVGTDPTNHSHSSVLASVLDTVIPSVVPSAAMSVELEEDNAYYLLDRSSISEMHSPELVTGEDEYIQEFPTPSSQPTATSLPRTPASSRPSSAASQNYRNSPSTPTSRRGKTMLPTPPRISSIGKGSTFTAFEPRPSRRRNTLSSSQVEEAADESPLGTPEGKLAPLNATMMKRRGKAPLKNENRSPGLLTLSPSKKGAVFNPEGDKFDRHINEVLETLPSSIRFKTRPGAETPVSGIADPRMLGGSRSRLSRFPLRPNVTIAPADSPPKKWSSSSDNEVKVYNLTQAGSDETIKLFVRLVGESQRVMVRVGGGWADLADYLRQYAEHHGSRTVSEGAFEVQTVNGTSSRRVSGATEQKAKLPVTPQLNRTLADDDGDGDEAEWLDQPQPRFSMGDSTSSDESAPPSSRRQTLSTHTTPTNSATKGSRPSTANTERPHSRQSTPDIKLSGPSSAKRGQLSEHKEKWVEGMIERAKQASAEKNKDETHKYFGELGKAGGTRRVIFRSSSAMSNRPNGGK